jgi:hypothetical protein
MVQNKGEEIIHHSAASKREETSKLNLLTFHRRRDTRICVCPARISRNITIFSSDVFGHEPHAVRTNAYMRGDCLSWHR